MRFTRWQAPRHGLRTVLAALALTGGVLACASPAAAQSDDARVRKLEDQVRALQRKVFPGPDGKYFTPEVDTSGAQTAPVQPPVGVPAETPMTDILNRLDSIESQLSRLTARSEVNENAMSNLEKRVDAMEAKVRAQFASWQGRGPAGAEPDRGTVAPRRTEAHVLVEPGGPATVTLNWVRPPDLRPDTAAVRTDKLVDALALQVLNRRLERIAAERSPPPFIAGRAVQSEIADSATLVQLVAVTQPGQWQPGLATIETEERRLVEQGVTAGELNREITEVRTALAAQVAGAATRQSAQLADAIVAHIQQHRVFTSPAESQRLFEAAVRGLTPERVNQAARALFAGEPVLYATSPAAIEGGENAILAAYRAAHAAPLAAAAARQVQPWPYTSFGTPGTVAERHELPADIGGTDTHEPLGRRGEMPYRQVDPEHHEWNVHAVKQIREIVARL